jgi:hypothetical protein
MKPTSNSSYDHFAQMLEGAQPDAALDWLAEEFHRERAYAEWFEVLKMKARREAGLPIVRMGSEPQDLVSNEALEQALYRACAIVGEQLFRDGQPAKAWTYYQLVGNRGRAAEFLRQIPATSDNAAELIDVAIGADVAPDHGLELLLQFRGPCDAITTIDQMIMEWPRETRVACTARLVRHVYAELKECLLQTIRRREGSAPTANNLLEMVDSRRWLFADAAFHIDPSHLAATVRLARLTTAPDALELARELCDYGRRLDRSLMARGVPPFDDLFEDHAAYFDAALGRDVDAVLNRFAARFDAASATEVQASVAAVMIDLLSRNERWSPALDWSLRGLNGADAEGGAAPAIIEIAEKSHRLADLARWYRDRDKLLLHCMALLRERDRR